MQITIAISKLGFGHLTRQFALCEEILNQNEKVKFQFIVSDHQENVFRHHFNLLKATTFSNFITPGFSLSKPDEVDLESTIYSYQMAIDFDTQIRDDTTWGQVLTNTDVLINDIEFFHNPIAKKMGIPIVNISNFTWSDLLEPIAPTILTNKIKEFESMSDYNIKLPFATECYSFGDQYEEYGLLARRSSKEKSDLIKSQFENSSPIIFVTSLPPDMKSKDNILSHLGKNYNLIITSNVVNNLDTPADNKILILPIGTYDIQNYIDAVDVVIGKTGYGLVSECVSTSTPLMYWTRKDYLEDSALSQGIQDMNLGRKIDQGFIDNIDPTIEEMISNKGKTMLLANKKISERILNL
ncbi:MAG: hypothetical protein GPJ54_14155 [Candidatus Heimdallarchaeota archaeon]|nr:hypothetical protein [Candidatus Heimdallarchaeota archaeon]